MGKSKKCDSKNRACIKVARTLLSAILNDFGEVVYTFQLLVKNVDKKTVRHLFIKDSLIGPLGNAGLISIDISPNDSGVVAVSQSTSNEILDEGNLVDPTVSKLKKCEVVTITYSLISLSNQFACQANSILTVGNKDCILHRSVIHLSACNDSSIGFDRNLVDGCDTTGPLGANCVKFEDADIGVENVTKTVIIDGVSVSVTLFNWVAKTDEPDEFIAVDFSSTGVILCASAKSGTNSQTIDPEAGTYVTPITHRILKTKTLEIQNAFSNLVFCLAPPVVCQEPTIIQQPKSQEVCAGESAQFSVIAGGSEPLSYQWQLNGNNLPDETGSTFTSDSSLAPGSYDIRVLVANSCGSVSSNIVVLTVNAPSEIISIFFSPSLAINVGFTEIIDFPLENVSLLIDGNAVVITDIILLGGGNNIRIEYDTFALAAGTHTATVNVVNNLGCTSSISANFIKAICTTIGSQPQSTSICEGNSAQFTVSATSLSPITYQWQIDNVNVAGATGTTFNTPIELVAGTYNVRVILGGNCGTVISNVAVLIVNALPVITGITVINANSISVNFSQTINFPLQNISLQVDNQDITIDNILLATPTSVIITYGDSIFVGTYTVTAVNNAGCEFSFSLTV